MDRKTKLIAAISMALLTGVVFSSIGVATYDPPTGNAWPGPPYPWPLLSGYDTEGYKTAEYKWYTTGGVNWGPGGWVNAPASHPDYPGAQPSGFEFKINGTVNHWWKADNISCVPPPPPPYDPSIMMYADSGVLPIQIKNNLGYDIVIYDLFAEVTAGNLAPTNKTETYYFPYDGGYWGNLSNLAVDPLNPAHTFWPGTDEELTGVMQVPPDNEEHYLGFGAFDNASGVWYDDIGFGPNIGKYCDIYGPTSLRQEYWTPTPDRTLLPPEILRADDTFTEYFAAIYGNNQSAQGAQLYGEITFTLVYLPREMDLELDTLEVVDLDDPTGEQWIELYPQKFHEYNLTEWIPSEVLSPRDQVTMNRTLPSPLATDFEVDDVTIGIELYDDGTDTRLWLYYKCGYWTFDPENPVCTKWNEIKREVGGIPYYDFDYCWHLAEWEDTNPDGRIALSDNVYMVPACMFPDTARWFHVEKVTVTLKLTEYPTPVDPVQYYLEFMGNLEEFEDEDKIRDPECTDWHEVAPVQGREYHLEAWTNVEVLSPSDHIVLTPKNETGDPIEGAEERWHVDKLTVAMNITNEDPPYEWHIVKFEGSLEQFKKYYWREDPVGTEWLEVNPDNGTQWLLTGAEDTGEPYGELSNCDSINLTDKDTCLWKLFHVESISTDMWVSKSCAAEITGIVLKHYSLPGIHVSECYKTWSKTYSAFSSDNVIVQVTVKNTGTERINCTVNAYFDTQQIGTARINNLNPCTSANAYIQWDIWASNLGVKVTYTVKANITITCGGSDELVDGTMRRRMWGDVNGLDDGATLGDVGKTKLVYSGVISWPYYPLIMPEVNGYGGITLGDVGKVKLIYSGVLDEADCPESSP